jgi:hypothetical protein
VGDAQDPLRCPETGRRSPRATLCGDPERRRQVQDQLSAYSTVSEHGF